MKVITLARKPLSENSVVANAAIWGSGALNIDGCRVAGNARPTVHGLNAFGLINDDGWKPRIMPYATPKGGRWPPNLIFTHKTGCRIVGERLVRAGGSLPEGGLGAGPRRNTVFGADTRNRGSWRAYGNGDRTETIPAWNCAEECPVEALDRSGQESGLGKIGWVRSERTFKGWAKHGELVKKDRLEQIDDRPVVSRFFPQFKASE